MIRVLLVDNDVSARAVLRMRLSLEPDLQVVGEAADRDTALALVKELVPDVVVMDVQNPGLNVTAVTAMLRRRCPTCAVVVLILHDTDAARIRDQDIEVTVVGKHEGDVRLLAAIRSAATPPQERPSPPNGGDGPPPKGVAALSPPPDALPT